MVKEMAYKDTNVKVAISNFPVKEEKLTLGLSKLTMIIQKANKPCENYRLNITNQLKLFKNISINIIPLPAKLNHCQNQLISYLTPHSLLEQTDY